MPVSKAPYLNYDQEMDTEPEDAMLGSTGIGADLISKHQTECVYNSSGVSSVSIIHRQAKGAWPERGVGVERAHGRLRSCAVEPAMRNARDGVGVE
jgi:hypothetical protein